MWWVPFVISCCVDLEMTNLKTWKLVVNSLKPVDSSDSDIDEKPEKPSTRATFDWNLLPVEMPVTDGGKIRPGLYSLQNMFSKTYVMMGPDGKLSCWPRSDFRNGDTKLVSDSYPTPADC